MSNLVRSIIEQAVVLGRPNTKGWYPVLCKICNDHGKKGKRAAFLFTDHGCTYNCFNCGHAAVYEPSTSNIPSKDMVAVFRAFSIPDTEWKKLSLDALKHNYDSQEYQVLNIEPDEISLPPFCYKLTDDINDDWCQLAIDYLTDRKIDWTSYPFYCVKKMDHPDFEKWYGRIVVPIYKENKLVFYFGRDMTGVHIKKYMSVDVPRDSIIYGYDKLLVYDNSPLFVVEGWFDAHLLNGVAVFGNKLTKQQITWLNRSPRPKVIIPDRFGDGHLLAEQAIDLGWSISTLDLNDVSKDITDSVIAHGLLYTIKTITSNIVSGNRAKIITNVYCKGRTTHGKRTK